MPVPSLTNILVKLRHDGLGASCRYAVHRAHAEYWERRLGIHTAGGHSLAAEGIVCADGLDYSPESYLDFQRAMKWLTAADFAGRFVDCGSGKGRLVLRAARYPFRCATGVELSPILTRIARENLAAARPRLRCPDVEFVTQDAATFAFPADTSCVFLYNPFGGAVLAAMLTNLRHRVERAGRPLALVVSTPDRAERALAGADWIRKAGEFHGLRRHVLWRAGGAGSAPAPRPTTATHSDR